MNGLSRVCRLGKRHCGQEAGATTISSSFSDTPRGATAMTIKGVSIRY